MRTRIALFTTIAFLSIQIPSASAQAVITRNHALKNELQELLVVWRDETHSSMDEMKREFRTQAEEMFGISIGANDLAVTQATTGSFVRVRLPQGMDPDVFAESLLASGKVASVERNQLVNALMIPNDPLYGAHQWNLRLIGMPAAWDESNGEGVTVAVIDSGVAYENRGSFRQAPDLAGTKFAEGYDFVGRDQMPDDENGHGTHIATVLAAATNNTLGIAGVASGVRIMPVKILNRYGQGTVADLADAIRWAADHGAKVINMSVGVAEPSAVLTQALAYAHGKGSVLVAAAGNDGSSQLLYPAAVHEYVIAVGAVDANGARAPYSNTGEIDVLAPGGDLNADVNGDGYGDGILGQTYSYRGRYPDAKSFAYTFAQGTSVAAPHVSGVAALIASRGIADPAKIRDILRKSATDLGAPGWDTLHGAGLIDAARALSLARPPSPASVQTLAEPLPEGQQLEPPLSSTLLPPSSSAPAEDPAPQTLPPPVPAAPAPFTLSAKLSFLNIFGRTVTSFVWWEAPRVRVDVTDGGGNPVSGAQVEIRYRYQGEQKDLGAHTGTASQSGTVEFTLKTMERKKTVEVGVIARAQGVNSALQMSSFTIR